jgi:hypothetical protein
VTAAEAAALTFADIARRGAAAGALACCAGSPVPAPPIRPMRSTLGDYGRARLLLSRRAELGEDETLRDRSTPPFLFSVVASVARRSYECYEVVVRELSEPLSYCAARSARAGCR